MGGIPGVLGDVKWVQERWGKDVSTKIKNKQKRKVLRPEEREKKIVEQTEIKIRSFPGVVDSLTR